SARSTSSVSTVTIQDTAEVSPRLEEVLFHRARGDPHDVGHLIHRTVAQVVQRHGNLLSRGQGPHRVGEVEHLDWCRPSRLSASAHSLDGRPATPEGTALVQQTVHRHPPDPSNRVVVVTDLYPS